jgi:hypothetical protein
VADFGPDLSADIVKSMGPKLTGARRARAGRIAAKRAVGAGAGLATQRPLTTLGRRLPASGVWLPQVPPSLLLSHKIPTLLRALGDSESFSAYP